MNAAPEACDLIAGGAGNFDIAMSEMPQLDFLIGRRKGVDILTFAAIWSLLCGVRMQATSSATGVITANLQQNDPTIIQRMSDGHIFHSLLALIVDPACL
jgi:hypothetical protein